jgi:deoxyadenosine/deoxycytidine kinase
MLKRERSEEKCVPLEYLKTVSQYHDEWLCKEDQQDVLVIDVDADFENTPEEWVRVRGLIQEFVEKKTKRD